MHHQEIIKYAFYIIWIFALHELNQTKCAQQKILHQIIYSVLVCVDLVYISMHRASASTCSFQSTDWVKFGSERLFLQYFHFLRKIGIFNFWINFVMFLLNAQILVPFKLKFSRKLYTMITRIIWINMFIASFQGFYLSFSWTV